ncbi:MAG TPA: hypothetical protein DDW60_07450 [Kandleria vitulina]|jgi:hypothetical protein|nr:hypothetical protein [Kandleria vitulina]
MIAFNIQWGLANLFVFLKNNMQLIIIFGLIEYILCLKNSKYRRIFPFLGLLIMIIFGLIFFFGYPQYRVVDPLFYCIFYILSLTPYFLLFFIPFIIKHFYDKKRRLNH